MPRTAYFAVPASAKTRQTRVMISVLAASLIAYHFGSSPQSYLAKVGFDGFLPVFGGQQGKAEVGMKIQVVGGRPTTEGHLQVIADLQGIDVSFNGAKLPLDLSNAREYFPKTTLSISDQGKILSTDAPKRQIPVRLPGLDIQHLPDPTFLPIEFPAEGINAGSHWTYSKAFGDSQVTYDVTATSLDERAIHLALKLSQAYDNLEDSAKNIPLNEKDAVAKVHTEVKGQGEAVFDRSLGVLRSNHLDAVATSTVTDMKGAPQGTRTLTTTLDVRLEAPETKVATAPAPTVKDSTAAYWQIAKWRASEWMAQAQRALQQGTLSLLRMLGFAY